ncbi:MAG: sulfotransferase [Candidatus Thorarchaeota archaeon]
MSKVLVLMISGVLNEIKLPLKTQHKNPSLMSKWTKEYQKDPKSERTLEKINDILDPIERELISEFSEPEKPVTFIFGAPRSATTLLHQLVANSGYFGYISNFLARFWKAPYFGALQEQVFGIRTSPPVTFQSDYGRTSGLNEPHHFSYFWHRWFQYDDNHVMLKETIDSIDTKYFKREIAALESVFNLPMLFRNLYCSLQIPFLSKTLNKARFVICLRNPLYQAQSILIGRKSVFGNTSGWFSLKPPEYFELIQRNDYEQIAGQIFYILKAIETSLEGISKSDYTIIQLERLVENPVKQLKKILNLIGEDQVTPNIKEKIPGRFNNRNKQAVTNKEWEFLKNSVKKYFGQENEEVPFRNHILYDEKHP